MDLHPGPPVCRTGALLSELRGLGAEGPIRTAGARDFSAALYLLSYLGVVHPSEGWVGFDRTWARFADGLLARLGHQPSDGADDGPRTRDLRLGTPALYRPELRPHGSGPRTRTSILGFKGRAPTARDEPGELARGEWIRTTASRFRTWPPTASQTPE